MTTVNPEGTGSINTYYPASVLAGGKVRLNFQVIIGRRNRFKHESIYVRPPTLRESQEFQNLHRMWLDEAALNGGSTVFVDPKREKWVAEWVFDAAGGSILAPTYSSSAPITDVAIVQSNLVGTYSAYRGPGSRGWASPHGLCRAVRELMGMTDAPVYEEEHTDEDMLFYLVATHLGKELDEVLELPLPIYKGWIAYLQKYGPRPTDVDPGRAPTEPVRDTLDTATSSGTTPTEGMVSRPGADHV